MAHCAVCGRNNVPDHQADMFGIDECSSCAYNDATPSERAAIDDHFPEDDFFDDIDDEADLDLCADNRFADDHDHSERMDFADPGGRSSLRAATRANPRIHPCPSCGRPNVLTPKDVRLGYQCNRCADAAEGCGSYGEGY